MAILHRFTRLLNRRHGFRRNDKRCAIDSAIGGGILIRILESLTDFENAIDNDGVDAFVSLELIALLVNVAKRFTMASCGGHDLPERSLGRCLACHMRHILNRFPLPP